MMNDSNYIKAQTLYNLYSTPLTNRNVVDFLESIFGEKNTNCFKSSNCVKYSRKFLNDFLIKNFPNETTIKAVFVKNVLMRTKRHVTIFELNSGSSRVDLCKVNGRSSAFEIKTDLDNPQRLNTQMQNYFALFEEVYLICSIQSINRFINHIPNGCGIYAYYQDSSGRYFFKKYRSAEISKQIDSKTQLSCLTINQLKINFKKALGNNKSDLIDQIILRYSPKTINSTFKNSIKDRYCKQWNFLSTYHDSILEIDYQWFFKNLIDPDIIYR